MSLVKKLFYNALLVQIVAGIVGVIGMVVDGAIIGSCLGTEAMAAYGFATPLATIFVACAGVCELGTSILVGKLVGARKLDEASKALSSCTVFAIVLSLVLTGVVHSFSFEIASMLGAQGDIAEMTSDYLRGFSMCAPALLLLMVFMPIMQIDGKNKLVMSSVVIMTVVNICGDLLVGFVFHGNLFGMAVATTVSYIAALLVMFPGFIQNSVLKLSLKQLSIAAVGEMISGGLPNALQQVCRSILIIVINNLILKISDNNSVAAFTVVMSAANLCMALGSGIGSSTSMLTGVFVGDCDDVAIKELVKIAVKKSVLFNAVLFVVLFAGAGVIMPLFTSDPLVLPITVLGFRVYCLSMIGYSVNVTLRLYYQAMKLSVLSYAYVICNSLLFTVIGALILGNTVGISGIWHSFLFGETMTLIALLIYVLIRADRSKSFFERFLFIPESMSENVIGRFDATTSSYIEVAEISEEVRQFCINKGADTRTSNILSLATEEIGEYILMNNESNRPKELIDVRVLSKTDCWSLRVRDNGKRFNPHHIVNEKIDDNCSAFGIKMIMNMVGDIEYIDTLNLNNLIVEIKKLGESRYVS